MAEQQAAHEAAHQAAGSAPVGWALDRAAFDLCGYSAPLPLDDPGLVEGFSMEKRPPSEAALNAHVHSAEVRVLLQDAGLRRAVSHLCGDGLNLWRSRMFWKGSGAGEIGWHHDKHFYSDEADSIRLDEIEAHYSVLIGLAEIGPANGMMEVIPGTHRELEGIERDVRPYHKRSREEHFLGLPDTLMAQRRPTPIPKACFMVFHSALLHRSLPHAGGAPRLGLAIRLVRDTLTVPAALAEPHEILPYPDLA